MTTGVGHLVAGSIDILDMLVFIFLSYQLTRPKRLEQTYYFLPDPARQPLAPVVYSMPMNSTAEPITPVRRPRCRGLCATSVTPRSSQALSRPDFSALRSKMLYFTCMPSAALMFVHAGCSA